MEFKPGTFENLSQEQRDIKNLIQKWLKEEMNVTDSKWNDWQTLRFCRARKFDVPKIKTMIQNYLDWCAKNNVDEIGNVDMTKYDKLKTLFGEGYSNTDKDGRPVYVIKAKEMNADEIFKNYTDEDLVQYYI